MTVRDCGHVDVLVVGAGLSGIGAAAALHRRFPARRIVVLEARERIGGTWDLFRYPGIRSDSDMQTLGFRARPWTDAESIADGPAILRYLQATADAAGVSPLVRHGRRVVRAAWSDGHWIVDATDGDGEVERTTCTFLYLCTGYYRYDHGYTPDFPDVERFAGRVVHPQHWPAGDDLAGQRVVVIGSGATAMTLVPALARTAAHVTMLQRSPSYVVALPRRDRIADALRRALPTPAAYTATRWKNITVQTLEFQLSRRRPDVVKRLIRRGIERRLPPGFDIDSHFTPSYDPWDQRVCLVADGDLFDALRAATASIVTDHVERFVEDGIVLRSGARLAADVVVTATGLELLALGGIELTVEGEPVDIPGRLAYRGLMLEGVPNLAFTTGYTNLSWTLKADLVCDFVVRVLARLWGAGHRRCVPERRTGAVTAQPFLEFQAGYVQRGVGRFPQQGSVRPWRLNQTYIQDLLSLRFAGLDDGVLRFVD